MRNAFTHGGAEPRGSACLCARALRKRAAAVGARVARTRAPTASRAPMTAVYHGGCMAFISCVPPRVHVSCLSTCKHALTLCLPSGRAVARTNKRRCRTVLHMRRAAHTSARSSPPHITTIATPVSLISLSHGVHCPRALSISHGRARLARAAQTSANKRKNNERRARHRALGVRAHPSTSFTRAPNGFVLIDSSSTSN